jgi:hypothetical protein
MVYNLYISTESATLQITHAAKRGEQVELPLLFPPEFLACYLGTTHLTFDIVGSSIRFIMPEDGVATILLVSKSLKVKFHYEFYFNRSDLLEFDKNSIFTIKAVFDTALTIEHEMSVRFMKSNSQGIETSSMVEMKLKHISPQMVVKLTDFVPLSAERKYLYHIGDTHCSLMYDFKFPDHLAEGHASIYRVFGEGMVFVTSQSIPFTAQGDVLSLNFGKSMKVIMKNNWIVKRFRKITTATPRTEGETCSVEGKDCSPESGSNTTESHLTSNYTFSCTNMTASEATLVIVAKSDSLIESNNINFVYTDNAMHWTVAIPSTKTEKITIEFTESVRD